MGAGCWVLEECWKDLHQGRKQQQRRSEVAEGGRNKTAIGTILRSSVCFLVWLLWVLVASGEIFSSGSWTLTAACGHSGSVARGILDAPTGIELVSPALQGGFLTPGPLGKSQELCRYPQ